MGQARPSPFPDNPSIYNITQTASGAIHTLLLTVSGTVYGYGQNGFGQLGLGDVVNRNEPTQIPFGIAIKQVSAGYYFSLILTSNGTVYSFGDNSLGQTGLADNNVISQQLTPAYIPSSLNVNITQITTGSYHCASINSNNQVIVWGNNQNGEIGVRFYSKKD